MKIITQTELEKDFIILNIPNKKRNDLIIFLEKKNIKNNLGGLYDNIRIVDNAISYYASDPATYNEDRFSHIKKYQYEEFYNLYIK